MSHEPAERSTAVQAHKATLAAGLLTSRHRSQQRSMLGHVRLEDADRSQQCRHRSNPVDLTVGSAAKSRSMESFVVRNAGDWC